MSAILKKTAQNLLKKNITPSRGAQTPTGIAKAPESSLREFNVITKPEEILEAMYPGSTKKLSIHQELIGQVREYQKTVSLFEQVRTLTAEAQSKYRRKPGQTLVEQVKDYYERADRDRARYPPFVFPPGGRPGVPEEDEVPRGDEPDLPPVPPPGTTPEEPEFRDDPDEPPTTPDDREDREEQFPSCEEIEKLLRALGDNTAICQRSSKPIQVLGRI